MNKTRLEEIREEANKYDMLASNRCVSLAFISGALWADTNPEIKELSEIQQDLFKMTKYIPKEEMNNFIKIIKSLYK